MYKSCKVSTGSPLVMRILVMRFLLMRLFKRFRQNSTYAIFPHKYSTYASFLHKQNHYVVNKQLKYCTVYIALCIRHSKVKFTLQDIPNFLFYICASNYQILGPFDTSYAIFHLCEFSQVPKCAYLEDPLYLEKFSSSNLHRWL